MTDEPGPSAERRAISELERVIRARVAAHPDEVWLKWLDEQFTWSHALSLMQRTANGLLELGIGPGETIAIMTKNRPEFLWTYFGAAMIGVSVVPVNISQRGPTLEHILIDSDACVVVCDSSLRDLVLAVKQRTDALRVTIVLDGPVRGIDRTFDQLLSATDAEPDAVARTDSPGAAIMYTSGTTGPPKGVVTERRQHDQSAFMAILASLKVRAGETIYTSLPLFHGNALYVSVVGSILLDAKLALAERFSASRIWEDCRKYEAVSFNTLGGMIPILLKQPESELDRSNPVRVILDAGCPAELWKRFEDRFAVSLVEWYGMVDAPGYLLNEGGPVGSMGRPVGGVEFKIVDDDGQPLPPNRIGELVFRDPSGRATRYHRQPDATESAYQLGWFQTGDLAEQDEAGWFYFRGRKKASIRRLGENISAWEIETVLNEHSAVLESAAFAVRSELGEDEVAVAVVPRRPEDIRAEELVEYCAGKMAHYAVPRYVFFLEEIPKTATERVQYGVLRERGLPHDAWDSRSTPAGEPSKGRGR